MKFLIENNNHDEEEINKIYATIKDPDSIDSWFEAIVPPSGAAKTAAGELVRAMMRILYRDYNDGDRFFSGYGLETCGGSAQYLMEKTNDKIFQKLEDIAYKDLDNQDYTDAINEVAFDLISYIKDNKQLLIMPNDDDSREDYELEDTYVPKYDFDFEIPEYIEKLIESGKYSEQELEDELYYWEVYGEQLGKVADSIEVDGNYIYINSVTEDVLNELKWYMDRWLKDFANDLHNEYGEIDDDNN